MKNDTTAKSWFCVLNHPEQHGYDGETPDAVLEKVEAAWIGAHPGGSSFLAYCMTTDGLQHVHAVLETGRTMRFSAVKKVFPAMHVEPTKGGKKDVEDYINKTGKFEDKNEAVICTRSYGCIQARQGKRSDLDRIRELIEDGYTPEEVFEDDIRHRRYESIVNKEFYMKRLKETPPEKEMRVYYHIGEPGSGKSHVQIDLKELYGRESVYVLTDYKNGFDGYNGEPVLFMDEFKGQMPFGLLLSVLDRYPNDIPARYANKRALWTEVHITSVLPPDVLYGNMAEDLGRYDVIEQLMRRLKSIIYHERRDGAYLFYEMAAKDYSDYDALKAVAAREWDRLLAV